MAGQTPRAVADCSAMAKADPRFPRPVVCEWCANAYRSIVPEEICKRVQGDGCAAHVWTEDGEWFLAASYGSSYDMSRFKFVWNLPTMPADPVCDNCIGERYYSGDLVRMGGEYLDGDPL